METLGNLIRDLHISSIVAMGPEHNLPICSYGNPDNLKDYYERPVEHYWVDPTDNTLYVTLGGEKAYVKEQKRA